MRFLRKGQGVDQKFVEWTQQVRDKYLNPLVDVLYRNGVRADTLTLLGFLSMLLFVFFLVNKVFVGAFVLLVFVLLLDGLDGPLARKQGVGTLRGAFSDMVADTLGTVIPVVALVVLGEALVLWGVLYAINVLLMQGLVFSILVKRCDVLVPLRTRSWFYLLMAIWIVFGVEFFDVFFMFFGAYMMVSNLYLFTRLRWLL